MKKLLIFLTCLFLTIPCFAQKITIDMDSTGTPMIQSGPWFGCTAKGNFAKDCLQVDGGYFFIADSNKILAGSLNYDTEFNTWGPQGYYFRKVRNRFYLGVSAGLDITNSDFNNTVMYAGNLLYLPGWKLLTPMQMFFNLRYVGRTVTVDQTVTEIENTELHKNTEQDNGELWLTLGLAGL